MDQNLLQLGATFLLAMSLIELVKFIIGKYFSKNGNNKTDSVQDVKIVENDKQIAIINQRLKTIEENHLPHILKEIEKNRDQHIDMMTKLIHIDTKLNELIK